MKGGKLRVVVLGSIGYGGIEDIRNMYDFLEGNGFDIVRHVDEKNMDYSHVTDFRYERELSSEIVEHDLKCIKQADVMVRVHNGRASEGSAIEMYFAKVIEGKKVVMLAKDPIPTPWPVHHCDYVVEGREELIGVLHLIEKELSMQQ